MLTQGTVGHLPEASTQPSSLQISSIDLDIPHDWQRYKHRLAPASISLAQVPNTNVTAVSAIWCPSLMLHGLLLFPTTLACSRKTSELQVTVPKSGNQWVAVNAGLDRRFTSKTGLLIILDSWVNFQLIYLLPLWFRNPWLRKNR